MVVITNESGHIKSSRTSKPEESSRVRNTQTTQKLHFLPVSSKRKYQHYDIKYGNLPCILLCDCDNRFIILRLDITPPMGRGLKSHWPRPVMPVCVVAE